MKLDKLREAMAAAPNDREGAAEVLRAIHAHLLDAGLSYKDLHPLFHIQEALEDHRRGKPHPLLAIEKKAGQRGHAADDMFKCSAAVTLALFQLEGLQKKEAARLIAEHLRGGGVSVTEATIINWHREIVSRKDRADGVQSSYYALKREFEGKPDAAQTALAILPGLPRSKL